MFYRYHFALFAARAEVRLVIEALFTNSFPVADSAALAMKPWKQALQVICGLQLKRALRGLTVITLKHTDTVLMKAPAYRGVELKKVLWLILNKKVKN